MNSDTTQETDRRMLVFLGNPGREYARTRHNVGWMVADAVESAVHSTGRPVFSWKEKFNALFVTAGTVVFLKPQLYMNRSGESVRKAIDFFSVPPERVLVVHDDIELAPGTVRLETGGGMRGHNGLKSIRAHLGTDAFQRFRMGIGRPRHGSPAKFVLERFSPDEEITVTTMVDEAVAVIIGLIRLP